jgi:hypothetical protein
MRRRQTLSAVMGIMTLVITEPFSTELRILSGIGGADL